MTPLWLALGLVPVACGFPDYLTAPAQLIDAGAGGAHETGGSYVGGTHDVGIPKSNGGGDEVGGTLGASVCSPNPCQNGGTCTDAVNAYSCECPLGYEGDVCSGTVMASCAAILAAQPAAESGVYTIDPDGMNNGKPPLPVFCDMTTDGGGYTRVGHEDVGASGTFKYLGLESGTAADVASASGNGYFGPRFAGQYHTLRISWSGQTSGFVRFHTEVELFANDVKTSFAISELETSNTNLSDWVKAAGGASFCRSSSSPDVRPGDTSWAIKPQNDNATECGCSGSKWAGQGAFYGGHLNATSCGGYGGGWAAVRAGGEAKAGMNDVATELWVR